MKKGLTFDQFTKVCQKEEIHYPINDLMCIMSVEEAEWDNVLANDVIKAMYKYYIRITKKVSKETNKRGTHTRFE
ncbi:hypothetical protein LCGC14_0728960 [marine sediment metagenome]|uniref:Uncharacterized protein n=1 Tax=marine sediment metagenome TaxID=412755 RepID=A0A0F9QED5_9ZZZZ